MLHMLIIRILGSIGCEVFSWGGGRTPAVAVAATGQPQWRLLQHSLDNRSGEHASANGSPFVGTARR